MYMKVTSNFDHCTASQQTQPLNKTMKFRGSTFCYMLLICQLYRWFIQGDLCAGAYAVPRSAHKLLPQHNKGS